MIKEGDAERRARGAVRRGGKQRAMYSELRGRGHGGEVAT